MREWLILLLPGAIEDSMVNRFISSPIRKMRSDVLFNFSRIGDELVGKFNISKVYWRFVTVKYAIDSLSWFRD